MELLDLDIIGLKLIKPKVFRDKRGFFTESYNKDIYYKSGIEVDFVQDNHSFSCKNTIRGMHFQKKPGQAKLVSVCFGEIFDVAVDIRKDSKTFGKWKGVILDDEKCHQLYIPAGFAHGFCVLSSHAHVTYKVSSYFDPLQECGFIYNDPDIKINWPVKNAILSDKDKIAPFLKEVL
jgi:dTDP-4-dehydrorhamnose 3,5-epimerase